MFCVDLNNKLYNLIIKCYVILLLENVDCHKHNFEKNGVNYYLLLPNRSFIRFPNGFWLEPLPPCGGLRNLSTRFPNGF